MALIAGEKVSMPFVTRFAPSPTGYLHLGHAYSGLVTFDAARTAGGRFLLRLEDIDQSRCRPEFKDAIYEDLAWLGLEWERPVRRQSEHFADYEAALVRLIDAGVVYRCFKTRKEIADDIARAPHLAPGGPAGPQYVGSPLPAPQEAALIAAGAPYAWRLSIAAARDRLGPAYDALTFTQETADGPVETQAEPGLFGDVVIAPQRRRDKLPPRQRSRRRGAARQPRHSRRRPESRRAPPPAATSPPRPADAGLPAPQADQGRRRQTPRQT